MISSLKHMCLGWRNGKNVIQSSTFVQTQGIEQSESMNDLVKDDFPLVLQTEFQRDAIVQYGSKFILMDATHGTTQYDYPYL